MPKTNVERKYGWREFLGMGDAMDGAVSGGGIGGISGVVMGCAVGLALVFTGALAFPFLINAIGFLGLVIIGSLIAGVIVGAVTGTIIGLTNPANKNNNLKNTTDESAILKSEYSQDISETNNRTDHLVKEVLSKQQSITSPPSPSQPRSTASNRNVLAPQGKLEEVFVTLSSLFANLFSSSQEKDSSEEIVMKVEKKR